MELFVSFAVKMYLKTIDATLYFYLNPFLNPFIHPVSVPPWGLLGSPGKFQILKNFRGET